MDNLYQQCVCKPKAQIQFTSYQNEKKAENKIRTDEIKNKQTLQRNSKNCNSGIKTFVEVMENKTDAKQIKSVM